MIFVSLAAYCEPLLAQTIAHACRMAEQPNELVFGVVDQHPHCRRDELLALYPEIKLRYVHVHPIDSRGVCWARTVVYSLYQGESHVLQIDSHTIFDLAWDTRLMLQLRRLQAIAAKPVITNYPWGFTMEGRTPVVDPARNINITLVLKPHPECNLSDTNATLRFTSDHADTDEPVPACHLGAGFYFTTGRFVQEVPYDPQLYFHGEEQSLALRAYTRGWDLFHLKEIPLYHQYKRAGESHENQHWHGRWASLRDVGHAQATAHSDQRLLDLVYQRQDLGIYGLGSQRSLIDYAREFGIDYPARHIRPRTDVCLLATAATNAGPVAQTALLTVLEVNPHAPRPFVFTDCALCLVESLVAAGVAARRSVNTIPSTGGIVVLGWTPGWLQAHRHLLSPERTFLFNAEQLSSASPVITPQYLQALSEWQVIDYHEANETYLQERSENTAHVTIVPLIPGQSVCYAKPHAMEPTVDVLFYGTVNPRRERVLKALEERGLKVEVVSGAYGNELSAALQRARVVLHVHYYDTKLYPALRMLQPVAMGVPVVCEDSLFSRWNDWSESGMVFAAYEDLATACEELVRDTAKAAEVSRRCREFADLMEMAPI